MGTQAEVEIAVTQFLPDADKTANLAWLRVQARAAAARGAEVVLAPEFAMFMTRGLDARTVAAAEPLDGPFVSGLLAIARETGAVIAAGVCERSPEAGRVYNTMVAAGPGGELLAVYRKLHLYDAFGCVESEFVRPGERVPPQTFTAGGVTFGLQACYDLRFPELSQRITDAGAQVLLVGSQWIRGPLKEDHWQTLLRARAIENTVFVAAAGQTPPFGIGCSLIADPLGVVLAGLGPEPGTARAVVSLAQLEAVRAQNPTLMHRRIAARDYATS